MTLIICDKNKELINLLKKEKLEFKYTNVKIIIVEGDVFDVKEKYPNAKICTASNPNFSAGGGLDKALKEKYPNEWNNLKEFVWTDNLFPLISVDKAIKSSKSIILRALAGLYGYITKYDFILTGLGTAIGGLSLIDFIETLRRFFSANLRHADLSSANLISANLRYADLSSANLISANLSSANLSKVKNMINKTKEFIDKFKFNKKGMIVYKGIGKTSYPLNTDWKIKKGEYLTEVVNPCKNCDCGCGVNFGTIEYIKKEYPESEIWECLIEFKDLVEVIVPYDTDGKARCSRLKLIRKIK
jgi:hypothetical protein